MVTLPKITSLLTVNADTANGPVGTSAGKVAFGTRVATTDPFTRPTEVVVVTPVPGPPDDGPGGDETQSGPGGAETAPADIWPDRRLIVRSVRILRFRSPLSR
jgi:hypothetical protein